MGFSRRRFLGAIGGAAGAGLFAQPASEMVLCNGRIITVDPAFSIRQAIAVRNGGTAVATRSRPARRCGTHIHLGGHSRRFIDLTGTTSLAQLQQQVRDKAKELGPNEWITGAGWDEYHFTDQARKPVRADLDTAAPNNPVVLTRAGGHSSVGNSKALELADINKATPNPDRGIIEKDASGEPNGVIRERNDLYTRLVPRDKPAGVRDSFFENVHAQLRLGITSVIQAGASVNPAVPGSWAEWEWLYAHHGEDLPRASVQIQFPGDAKTGDGNERLRVGSIGEMAATADSPAPPRGRSTITKGSRDSVVARFSRRSRFAPISRRSTGSAGSTGSTPSATRRSP